MTLLVALVVALLGVAFATGAAPGGGTITQPMIDAIQGAGGGILGPIGALLGVLVTIAIGFAILKTIRG